MDPNIPQPVAQPSPPSAPEPSPVQSAPAVVPAELPATEVTANTPPSAPPIIITRADNPEPRKSSVPALPFIILSVFLFLALGLSAMSYFIATGKMAAPPAIKDSITSAVFSLPFVPKPPEYVISSAIIAGRQPASADFSLDLSFSSPSLQMFTGSTQASISLSGYADFTNIDNPVLDVNADFTDQFKFKTIFLDNSFYFKAANLPPAVSLFMGNSSPEITRLLTSWISIDSTKYSGDTSELRSEKYSTQIDDMQTVLKDVFLPYLKMTQTDLNGTPSYKFIFAPTPQELDTIQEKLLKTRPFEELSVPTANTTNPSQFMASISITAWLDQKNYRLLQLESYTSQDLSKLGDNLPTGQTQLLEQMTNGKIESSLVLKLKNHGQTKQITAPVGAIPLEQAIKQLTEFSQTPASPEANTLPPILGLSIFR